MKGSCLKEGDGLLLDHVVHFVEKPELLVPATRQIGLHTVNGGKHEMWGTYNSLCYFGLSYVEFIGIFDEDLFEISAKEPYTLHETYQKRTRQNGALRIAMRTTTIEKDAEAIRVMGYEINGPQTFSRTRPDGSLLKWKLLHFGKRGHTLDFPFIIQWEGHDDARKGELEESGILKPHPVGNLQLEEVVIGCSDVNIAHEWGKILRFQIETSPSSIKLKGENCRLIFEKGNNQISRIVFSGAREAKNVRIEGTQYVFNT